MKNLLMLFGAMGAFVVMAGPAMAADAVSAGKIKAVNAEKKDFVLTDSEGKDWTIKLGDNVVINRGGKESQSDLNAGDPVNVCYDKGLLTWTAITSWSRRVTPRTASWCTAPSRTTMSTRSR